MDTDSSEPRMCNGGQASAISGNGEDGTQATWHGKQAGEGAGLYGLPFTV